METERRAPSATPYRYDPHEPVARDPVVLPDMPLPADPMAAPATGDVRTAVVPPTVDPPILGDAMPLPAADHHRPLTDGAAWGARPLPARRPAFGVPVPLAGAGTCRACHGPAAGTATVCWCCRQLATQLGQGAPPVLPVALFRTGDAVHATLRGYKDATAARARSHLTARLAASLGAFVDDHQPCLRRLTGRIDAVCAVPATRLRTGGTPAAGPHVDPTEPVQAVLGQIPALAGIPPVRLAPGPGPARHLHASATAFRLAEHPSPGARVLLVDDTWTTGAHARSAAATLRSSGCTVVAVLVMGRAIDPTASAAVHAWWRRTLAEALQPASAGQDAPGSASPCCLPWCGTRRQPAPAIALRA